MLLIYIRIFDIWTESTVMDMGHPLGKMRSIRNPVYSRRLISDTFLDRDDLVSIKVSY